MTAHWQAKLHERGIAPHTIERFKITYEQWSDGREFWRYPVAGSRGSIGVYRRKNLDSKGKPKYHWDFGKHDGRPADITYYALGHLTDAIKAHNGDLWLCGGEPNVWVMHSAFCASAGETINATNWLTGEADVPETLADDLAAWGVRRAFFPFDRDETGIRSAVKVWLRLRDTDIEYTPFALSGEIGSGYDLNDLWRDVGFDGQVLDGTLGLCDIPTGAQLEEWHKLYFEKHEDDAPLFNPPPPQPSQQGRKEFPEGFLRAIESALGVTKYKRSGYSNDIPCIINHHEHDEERPAAGWHGEFPHFKCFKCNQVLNAIETGTALGIDWHDYIPKRQEPRQMAQSAPPDEDDTSAFERRRESLVHRSADLATRYINTVRGTVIPAGEPVVFPYSEFHDLQGLCRIIPAGMAVGLLAASGEGKTSFTESGVDLWNKKYGVDVGMWGPEWTPDYFMWRRIQRYGGPTFTEMVDWQLWLKEGQLGIPEEYRQGRALSTEAQTAAIDIANDVSKWYGQTLCFYDGDPTANYLYLEDLLDYIGATILAERRAGRRLNVIVYDYVQLAELRQRVESGNPVEMAIAKLKNHAMRYHYVAWIASQATKVSSRSARAASASKFSADDVLKADDALYVRDDKFNLFLTIKRIYDTEPTPQGQRDVATEFSKVYIAKNSVARSREIKLMRTDWTRMLWLDEHVRVEMVSLNDEDEDIIF